MWGYIIAALAVWNFIVLCLYGIDKRKAARNKRRISEKALMLTAAIMGAPGALVGMILFRHKTKHAKFVIGLPLLLLLNIAIVFVFIRFFVS